MAMLDPNDIQAQIASLQQSTTDKAALIKAAQLDLIRDRGQLDYLYLVQWAVEHPTFSGASEIIEAYKLKTRTAQR